MRLQRWLSVILMMGLVLVLSPIGAQAWQHPTSARQPNYHGFAQHRPYGNANGWHHGQQSHWNRWNHRNHFAQRHHPGNQNFRQPYGAPYARGGYPGQPQGSYRGGYQGQPQGSYFNPGQNGHPHAPFVQAGQPAPQPGFFHPGSSWNPSAPQPFAPPRQTF